MELRPYQLSAIEGARARFREGAQRCLIIMPTGGGKTVVASEVIRAAAERGRRALFLAHRRELILQSSNKLTAFGVRHGVIMAGIRPALQHPVQVASVQTLARRADVLSHVDLLFLDEAHHVTKNNQYSKVLERWPQALVLGLTATPWRLDGVGLSDVFDTHVLATTPRQLRDEGFLVPVGGWEYEGIETAGARVQGGDFVAKDLEASATSQRVVGDIIGEWQRHAAGKRTVLFAASVAQSKLMVEEFLREGVPAEHLDGEMKVEERDAVLQRLRAGTTLVVCNCNVLTEGFDEPSLEVCILARPTLSTALYLQMVGRVLRPVCFDCLRPASADSHRCSWCGSERVKRLARIHDHAGCLAAHGHPYAERDFSPAASSRASRKGVERKDGASPQKRCSACKSVLSRWPCDACGYSPTPEELTIEYEPAAARREITADGAAPEKKKQKVTAEERATSWKRWHRADGDHYNRYQVYRRLAKKWGAGVAVHKYEWLTGHTEKVPRSWRSAAEEYERQQQEGQPAS